MVSWDHPLPIEKRSSQFELDWFYDLDLLL